MIRKTLKVNSDTVSINVPKNYMGKLLEIIAFTKEETGEQVVAEQENVTFDAVALDTRNFKFDRDKANER